MMRIWLSRWRWVRPCPKRHRVRPRLEALEDRRVPAVFNPLPSIPDGAPGSLRYDIITANHNGQDNIINLQPGHYLLTIPNTAGEENAAATGDLDLTSIGHTITIQGAGSDVTVVDAGGIDRVFQVIGDVTVEFRNLTITGGRAVDNGTTGSPYSSLDALGGGILIGGGKQGRFITGNNGPPRPNGTVTLDHVLVENNMAVGGTDMHGDGEGASGGGISCGGTLLVIDSTIANNEAIGGNGGATSDFPGQTGFGGSAGGGGIAVFGYVSLIGSTIEGNEALGGNGGNGADGTSGSPVGKDGGVGGGASGGGLSLSNAGFTIVSSTISGNVARGGAGGNGGLGFASGNGGNGGWGGSVTGGGISIYRALLEELTPAHDIVGIIGGPPSPPIAPGAMLSNSTVADNTPVGGDGGTGGNSLGVPGNGGSGGSSQGGGILDWTGGSISVENSTVAFNQAKMSHGGAAGTGTSTGSAGGNGSGDGGGLYSPNLYTLSSIFADNVAEGGTHADFSGSFALASHVLLANNSGSNLAAGSPDANGNLVGTAANPIDPKLRPLGFYGGPTQTVALYADSPAINAGLNPNGLTSDQRGFGPRSVSGATDIGSFEFGALPVVASSQPPPTSAPVAGVPTFTTRLVRVHHRTRLDVFDAVTGQLRLSLFPFGASRGKVQVVMGDVNHDGVADIIVLDMEAHHLRMRVFSGTDLSDLTTLIS
jgi:hypothetical protein